MYSKDSLENTVGVGFFVFLSKSIEVECGVRLVILLIQLKIYISFSQDDLVKNN